MPAKANNYDNNPYPSRFHIDDPYKILLSLWTLENMNSDKVIDHTIFLKFEIWAKREMLLFIFNGFQFEFVLSRGKTKE